MKKLFIYSSYTGNGEVVAQKYLEKGYDIRKVEPVKGLPKSFFLAMMKGGFQAAVKKKAKLKEFDQDISEYDEIVIGSPIWNARLAITTNQLLTLLDLNDKKVSFTLYSGGGTAPKAIKRLEKEYPQATYIILKEPKKYPDELNKII